MLSPQSLSESDRRLVASWAADCAERVLAVFEAEAPADDRPRDAISRTREFARGERDAAGEIRIRFVAGLRQLPLLGDNSAGPLGPAPLSPGLLAAGVLGENIRRIQDFVTGPPSR